MRGPRGRRLPAWFSLIGGKMITKFDQDTAEFIEKHPTCFHVIAGQKTMLEEAGISYWKWKIGSYRLVENTLFSGTTRQLLHSGFRKQNGKATA